MRILLAFMVLILATPALACMTAETQHKTFLHNIPKGTLGREVVAQVEIVATLKNAYQKETRTKVIKAIKGVKLGQRVIVMSDTSDCALDTDAAVGEQYYIVGKLDQSGKFSGEWNITLDTPPEEGSKEKAAMDKTAKP